MAQGGSKMHEGFFAKKDEELATSGNRAEEKTEGGRKLWF